MEHNNAMHMHGIVFVLILCASFVVEYKIYFIWYYICIEKQEKGKKMHLEGIFENKNGELYWMDCLSDDEMKEAKYFADACNSTGVHRNIKSVLYDDMTCYIDEIQDEYTLPGNELYVVTYYKYEDDSWGLSQYVDFGITKQEIIKNVKAQKYVEGATYYTMGQMFYTTSIMLGKI